jgi:hypothetical protein
MPAVRPDLARAHLRATSGIGSSFVSRRHSFIGSGGNASVEVLMWGVDFAGLVWEW